MKKKKIKNRKNFSRLTLWLGIIVIGFALGIAIQFTRAWLEPSITAPGGDIAAPINVGAATQTKTGGDICIDYNGQNICLGNKGSSFPQGTIAMWSGQVTDPAAPNYIPAGWALCDGQNGTPDLRNRFVYGVASGQDPGGTGGSTSSGVPVGGANNTQYGSGGPWFVNSAGPVSTVPPYYRLAFIMKE